MSAKKIRATKPLKKPEKKLEAPSLFDRVRGWMENHQYILSGAIAVLVLAILATWAMSSVMKSKETARRAAYAQAIRDWPAEDYTDPQAWRKVAGELEEFIKKREGSRLALNAELDLARALFEEKKYDDAAKHAEAVLKKLSSGDELKPLARYQLAMAYSAAGNSDKALEEWKALKNEGPVGNVREVNWQLARIYAQKGDYAKAVEYYEQALTAIGEYPGKAAIEQELAFAKSKRNAAS